MVLVFQVFRPHDGEPSGHGLPEEVQLKQTIFREYFLTPFCLRLYRIGSEQDRSFMKIAAKQLSCFNPNADRLNRLFALCVSVIDYDLPAITCLFPSPIPDRRKLRDDFGKVCL